MTGGIEVVAVTPACMHALAELFEGPGGPRHCWCRVWRAPLAGMNAGPAAGRRAIRRDGLAGEVAAGIHVGLLAREGETPVGWCACGPREGFARLGTPPAAVPGALWSVGCFYVPAARRRQGVAGRLLAAAVAAATAAGARQIEATPVMPDSPSFRFAGFVAQFAAAGFSPAGPLGRRRHRMIRTLAAPPPGP